MWLAAMFLTLGLAFPLCAWMTERDMEKDQREHEEWLRRYRSR